MEDRALARSFLLFVLFPYPGIHSCVIKYARQNCRACFAFDKGKPVDRRGRKVMDPALRDRQTAESCTSAVLFQEGGIAETFCEYCLF